jgi:hypothetical protein
VGARSLAAKFDRDRPENQRREQQHKRVVETGKDRGVNLGKAANNAPLPVTNHTSFPFQIGPMALRKIRRS